MLKVDLDFKKEENKISNLRRQLSEDLSQTWSNKKGNVMLMIGKDQAKPSDAPADNTGQPWKAKCFLI